MNIAESYRWPMEACAYGNDAAQRGLLYLEMLRKRGNNYLAHIRDGQPPVLVFDHETVMEGATMDRPANYSLVRIINKRDIVTPNRRRRPPAPSMESADRRTVCDDRRPCIKHPKTDAKENERPIIFIDPRAGHGPGIGGSKQESQVGMALDAGHPVYFMIFSTDPMPGQTLTDVRNVQIRFIEEVRRRHPDAHKPAIVGNCQGGWAAALVGAERPDLVGPMVFNGSPLSYWAGVVGINPMRYLGGLWGGVWINSLLSDIGNGIFDGANLVGNFESLNPSNTLWTKQYHAYANVDTEEKRYLDFEKWWGGFFMLSAEEIHQIVEGLFVGNKLERGEFELDPGRPVDLKCNNNPVVVFSSFGDNITPPQQALNWIVKTYGTVEEIKRREQVIVSIGHSSIGHLGIFVSAKIARKEHKKIIASFEMLDFLPPGLYAMDIKENPNDPGDFSVTYVEQTMDDIMAMGDGWEDEEAFYTVRQLSQINDRLYRCFVGPWIRWSSNAITAETGRQLHPMRVQRYWFSDLNPWMVPIRLGASLLHSSHGRQPVSRENPFWQAQERMSETIVAGLDSFRDMRDNWCESIFKTAYENPWIRFFSPKGATQTKPDLAKLETLRRQDADQWLRAMEKGGFAEAIVRILLALGLADQKIKSKSFYVFEAIVRKNERLKALGHEKIKEIVRSQYRILQTDTDQAIASLPRLLSTKEERSQTLAIVNERKDSSKHKFNPMEQDVFDRIISVLKE